MLLDVVAFALAAALLLFVGYAAVRALDRRRTDGRSVDHSKADRLSLEEDARRSPF